MSLPCSISTCTWFTRSRRRRRSRACAVRGAKSARRIGPSRRTTTMSRRPIGASRSPIPIRSCRSRRCRRNCADFGLRLFDIGSGEQGIVHVIGPELGLTQPGMTIVCGDSHTATHGAFGALAFGIGTSEVEHVLATQCLWEERPQTLEIRVDGKLGPGVGAKDLILGIIGRIKTDGATGHVIEYRGAAIEALSMEERMTGVQHVDRRRRARRNDRGGQDHRRLFARPPVHAERQGVRRTGGAMARMPQRRGREVRSQRGFDAATFAPQVTWGTNPGMVTEVGGSVPNPAEIDDNSSARRPSGRSNTWRFGRAR